jgi:hypothetical protein
MVEKNSSMAKTLARKVMRRLMARAFAGESSTRRQSGSSGARTARGRP